MVRFTRDVGYKVIQYIVKKCTILHNTKPFRAPTMYYLITCWLYVAIFKLNNQTALNDIHINRILDPR